MTMMTVAMAAVTAASVACSVLTTVSSTGRGFLVKECAQTDSSGVVRDGG
jgi:hypothetical protein